MRVRGLVYVLAGWCAFAAFSFGATSAAWETASYADYLKGRLSGLSLHPDGVLRPGSPLRWEAALGQPALWSIAPGPDGTTYAATGHGGRVYRINSDGRPSVAWNSGTPEVFAIASDGKGSVWAGSSPGGGVYRLDTSGSGKAVEVWRSPEKYIWAIVPAPDGSLYVATGEAGRIYRIDGQGKASIYYETGQGNVTALTRRADGRMYAGTEPNGLVYEITGAGKATVLYDSPLPEIRAIVEGDGGAMYVAAMGGAVSTRNGTGTAAAGAGTSGIVTAATPTVITVTEAEASAQANTQAGARITDAARAAAATATPGATANAGAATVSETSGVDKSAIYRIAPDRTVDTIRTSKEDNVYDLLWNGNALWFSTDAEGRVFKWQDDKSALVAELGTGETTRLMRSGQGLMAAVSNPARLVSLGPETAAKAGKETWFESPVHDSGSVARWGHVMARPGGAGVKFLTRTGNSVRPDATWSAWIAATGEPGPAAVASPVARYIQWRAEWGEGQRDALSAVTLSYLAQNAAPVVRSLTVSSVMGANAAKNAATTANSTAAYSITVTDSGDASAPSSTTTTTGPSQTVSRLQSTQTQVTWQADDPDGDKLVYALYFRAEDAGEWQMIRSRMYENTLLLDPDVLADGRYLFRLVASDSPSNAAALAKKMEYVSSSVLVDNTPPTVTINKPKRNGTEADVEITAADATSALKRAEYSLDASWWQPLEAADGITDTPREEFAVHLEKLKPGEHLLVVRVFDSAGNAGLGKVLLQ